MIKMLYGSLWHYFSRHWLFFLIGLIGLLMTNFSVLSIGKILGELTNSDSVPGYLSTKYWYLILIVSTLVIGSFLRNFMVNYFSEKALWQMGEDVYKNILSLSPKFFHKTSKESISMQFSTDINVTLSNLGNNLSFMLRNIVTIVGSLTLIIYSSWIMSLYVLLIVPILSTFIIIAGKKVRKVSKNYQESLTKLLSKIDENINNLNIVQSFCQEGRALTSFRISRDRNLLVAKKRILSRAFFVSAIMSLVFIVLCLLVIIGHHYVITDRISQGAMVSFTFYSLLAATALGGFADSFSDVQRALAAYSRLLELLNAQSEVSSKSTCINIREPVKGEIIFDNVSFSYDEKSGKILNGMSARIAPGENLAILGMTGAGKSTICALLLRFYNIDSGAIYLDGIPIDTIALSKLRSFFGYVPSEPRIFQGSILDNITYGAKNPNNNEINKVIQIAALESFVSSLPDGLNHVLSSNNVLSSGQKQRIAIARALINKPSILLFDEASSALDYETERLVRNNIAANMPSMTKIFITHRLQILQPEDKVLVLNEGRVESYGSFAQVKSESKVCLRLLKEDSY